MKFEERNIILKDGRLCTLRPAGPDDAEDLIRYMKETAGETPFLLRYPDEVDFTIKQEEDILGSILNSPHEAMMVGIVDGKLAGNCSISGLGMKRKTRHRCSLAIALYKEYWHLGLGAAMISYLNELAGRIGYEQVELEAASDNENAIALYRKCGFTESGRRVRALKYADGSYQDEILMYKIIQ